MSKRGIYLAPFDELADPRLLAGLARLAEERGWDGLFLWDRVAYPPAGRPVADPWVALSAIAVATTTLRLGPMVVPLARRRVQKVARESVTLDLLSDGRMTMGVGLGNPADFADFGESVDPAERARALDEGLARLDAYWGGEFRPVPVQQPRMPVWVAAKWPNRRPIERSLRWDGLFPIGVPAPEALAGFAAPDGFDLVVDVPPGADPRPWAQAGATWVLTSFEPQPSAAAVRDVIDSGP